MIGSEIGAMSMNPWTQLALSQQIRLVELVSWCHGMGNVFLGSLWVSDH